MDPDRATALAAHWRHNADSLDAYARRLRSEGDTTEAQDAEQAATEWRIEADNLEMQFGRYLPVA